MQPSSSPSSLGPHLAAAVPEPPPEPPAEPGTSAAVEPDSCPDLFPIGTHVDVWWYGEKQWYSAWVIETRIESHVISKKKCWCREILCRYDLDGVEQWHSLHNNKIRRSTTDQHPQKQTSRPTSLVARRRHSHSARAGSSDGDNGDATNLRDNAEPPGPEPAAAAAESTHARPDRPSSDCGASASGEAASSEAASLTKNLSSTSSVVLATVLVPSPHFSSSSGRQSSAAAAESSQSQFEQITLAAAGLLRGQH